MKTSKRAQWKPIGNNGIPDTEITWGALSLVGDVHKTEAEIASWSQDQRDEVYDWVMRIHYKAYDNNSHIRIPDRPEFLA